MTQPHGTGYIAKLKQLSLEGQEALVSLMFEPYGELVDDLASSMCADEATPHKIDGSISVSKTLDDLAAQYDWTESIDFASEAAQARVWYVSEEKLEPRLGERFEEPLEPYEQPLSPGRDAVRMYHDLKSFSPDATIGEFLLRHPEHRHIARRLQLVDQWQYGEIRNNTIAADMVRSTCCAANSPFSAPPNSIHGQTAGFALPCTRAHHSRMNCKLAIRMIWHILNFLTAPPPYELVSWRDGRSGAKGSARVWVPMGSG